jgi:hypothetical protein
LENEIVDLNENLVYLNKRHKVYLSFIFRNWRIEIQAGKRIKTHEKIIK